MTLSEDMIKDICRFELQIVFFYFSFRFLSGTGTQQPRVFKKIIFQYSLSVQTRRYDHSLIFKLAAAYANEEKFTIY